MANSSNSLYRKYRPSTFSDVAGHKNVVEILETQLKNNNFGHAYLFAGQRGTGKTSIARILAKAINCLDLQDGNPCDKCENCIAFNENKFSDVYEIDAASNNGVDEIRNIKNNVQTLPIIGKYKIYIIDEVHMLTKGAFNALLKTLEEPPAHVVFILATTEYDKIPATIISRCQSFSFRKISNHDMNERLNFIAENEGYKLDQESLNEIYDISEGSLRDALNVLEQLMVVCDETKEITINDIKKIFYVATKSEKLQIIHDILDNKSQKVIDYFELSKREGMDFNVFTLALIKIIKEIIEFKLTNNNKFLDVIDETDAKTFDNVSTASLFDIVDNLTEAYIKTKNNNASFDYILLSVLKTIKTNDSVVVNNEVEKELESPVLEKEASEEVGTEISDDINTNDSDSEPTPETKIELEKEQPSPIEQESSENDSNEDSFEKWEDKTIKGDIENDNKVEEPNDFDDEDLTEDFSTDESNEQTFISDDTKIESVSHKEQIKEPKTLDNPQDLYNEQLDLTINDNSKRDIKFLINDIVNVLMGVVNDRNPNLRHDLNDKLASIFVTNSDNKFENVDLANEFVSLLQASVVAANNNEVIIQTDTLTQANFINKELTDENKRQDLMNVLGEDYVVYAISKKDWNESKNTFKDLKIKNLLPEYEVIDFDEFYKNNKAKSAPIESKEDKELLEKASQLFNMEDIEIGD